MARFEIPEHIKQGPQIQMAPLIDIVFLTLILFMYIAAFGHIESQIDISVPKAVASEESTSAPGEIIVNVTKDGSYIVNDQTFDEDGLAAMLSEVSSLFDNQQVIIRADEETFHKYVVAALDACASANIWDVSFATVKEQPKK